MSAKGISSIALNTWLDAFQKLFTRCSSKLRLCEYKASSEGHNLLAIYLTISYDWPSSHTDTNDGEISAEQQKVPFKWQRLFSSLFLSDYQTLLHFYSFPCAAQRLFLHASDLEAPVERSPVVKAAGRVSSGCRRV